jgi:flagellar motor switch protein FliG
MKKKIDDLSGYDKASIIVDLLGDSLALNIFRDIPEVEFIKLRRHAKNISTLVSTFDKKKVLDDYYFKMLSIEKFQQVSLNKNMFDFLNNLDDERLYVLLSNEKPVVIALALEQIENKKRMAFLSKLNQEMQTQIVLQTGDLNDIPLETVIYVAKDLKKKATFLPGPVEFSRGGGKSVSEMLSKMSEEDADQDYLVSFCLNTALHPLQTF